MNYFDSHDTDRITATHGLAAYVDASMLQQQYTRQVRASEVLDFDDVAAECKRRQANGATVLQLLDFLRGLLESEEPLADYLSYA